jgi:sulfur carrier protein ThiS
VKVTVRVLGALRQHLPAGKESGALPLEVPDGSTAADLPARLGIPPATPLMLVVNGTRVPAGSPGGVRLTEGDLIVISPAIRGG